MIYKTLNIKLKIDKLQMIVGNVLNISILFPIKPSLLYSRESKTRKFLFCNYLINELPWLNLDVKISDDQKSHLCHVGTIYRTFIPINACTDLSVLIPKMVSKGQSKKNFVVHLCNRCSHFTQVKGQKIFNT
jgi:hypothetical protein